MTATTHTRALEAGIWQRIAVAAHDARVQYAQHRLYKRTLKELSALSPRELADLGIHRSMIDEIAREAVYAQ